MRSPGGGAGAPMVGQLGGDGLEHSAPTPDPQAHAIRDPRRQRLAAHLHRCGPRPVLEALQEVANGRPLDDVLADFGGLDSEVCRAVGGHRFPPLPLSEVA